MTEDEIETKDKEEVESTDKKEEETKTNVTDGECDPATMDCGDMPDEMERLIRKEIVLEGKLESLDKLSDALPEESETFEKIEDKMTSELEKIQDVKEKIITRFTMCRPPLDEEESEKEE